MPVREKIRRRVLPTVQYGVAHCCAEEVCKVIALRRYGPKRGCERLPDRRFMLTAQRPQERGRCADVDGMSVGLVEDVLDHRHGAGIIDEGNRPRILVRDPVQPPVPYLDGRAGGGVTPLGIYQQLLVERVFVKPGGGGQKVRPVPYAGGYIRRRIPGQLRKRC